MRASELLGGRVVDAAGADLGPVRDVRVTRGEGGEYRIAGIVVGGGRLAAFAHAVGLAEGRVQGPWLLRAICADAIRCTRVVNARDVVDWGPSTVRLAVRADELMDEGGRDA